MRVDPETAWRDPAGGGIVDYFYHVSPAERVALAGAAVPIVPVALASGGAKPPEEVKSQLF